MRRQSMIRRFHACFDSGGGHSNIGCKFGLGKSKDSTVIKLGTRNLNLLRHLSAKYCLVKVSIAEQTPKSIIV